jgi:hypothetical protein
MTTTSAEEGSRPTTASPLKGETILRAQPTPPAKPPRRPADVCPECQQKMVPEGGRCCVCPACGYSRCG